MGKQPTFARVLAVEGMKLRRSQVGWLLLLGPVMATLGGVKGYLSLRDQYEGLPEWLMLYSQFVLSYAMLFLPILVGVFAAMVCRFEHQGNAWKQWLALPVSRSSLYLAKGTMVLGLLLAGQVLLLLLLLAAGYVLDVTGAIPWGQLLIGLLLGWVATFPLAALQLWVSTVWKSFAAPLALNVIFTLPAVAVANSATYGPWYPWAQPLLAMLPKERAISDFSQMNFWVIVVGGFLVLGAAGWRHFVKRDVA
jgi:hypothetical protein